MKFGFSSLFLSLVFFSLSSFSQQYPSGSIKEFMHPGSESFFKFTEDTDISQEGWGNLSQVQFWQKVIQTSPDSVILNAAGSRKVLDVFHRASWYRLPYQSRRLHLNDLKRKYRVRGQVLVTQGKSNYYQIRKVIPQLPGVFDVFEEEDVDPWYAQTILLIESPGRMRMSPSGAYGHFQLMKKIGIKYGLTINRHVDERSDLKKSAHAAARLIRSSCIPEAKMVLRRVGITPDETKLWFRLIVLHIYHAGTRNVQTALTYTGTKRTGITLMKRVWQVRSKDFQSASRNYSQIALAANLELQRIIKNEFQVLRTHTEYEYLRLLTAY